MSDTSTTVDVDIDLMAEAGLADPSAYFSQLRATQPVFWDRRYRSWIVTSYRHVSEALRDDDVSPVIASSPTSAKSIWPRY